MALEPLLISFADAASLLGISRALFYAMHSDGRLGPIPHKLGRRSLLSRKELAAWVDAEMPMRVRWLERKKDIVSGGGNNIS